MPKHAAGAPVQALDMAVAGVITGLALWLRLWGNNFGLPSLFGTDEWVSMDTALSPGVAAHRFIYGPGLGYIIKLVLSVYWVIGAMGGRFHAWDDLQAEVARDPTTIYIIARSVGGFLGALTVLLVVAFGVRWYGRMAAYAGAFLLAVNATHSRESHYVGTDVPMAFFVTAALGYAVAAWEQPDRRRMDMVAILLGLATAMKYNAIAAVAVPVLVHWRHRNGGWREFMRNRDLRRSLAIMLSVVALISWSAILRPMTLAHDLASILAKPFAPFPGHARSLLSWLAGPKGSFAAEFGWPALVLAPLAIWWALRKRRAPDVVLLAAALPVLFVSAASSVRIMRYVVPALPSLCLLTGAFLSEAVRRVGRWRAAAYIVALAAVAAWPLYATVQRDKELASPDTRNIAAAWARKHLPAESSVLMDRSHGLYYPPLDETRFEVLWLPPLSARLLFEDQSPRGLRLSDYASADYAVLSNYLCERYYRAETRARHPRISAAYRSLFEDIRAHRQVARFAPVQGRTQGPLIEIYDLRKPQQPHAQPPG